MTKQRAKPNGKRKKPDPIPEVELVKSDGRPSSYSPAMVELARRACAVYGSIDAKLADFIGVSLSTINRWKVDHPEFLEALKLGKAIADERVEESLFEQTQTRWYDAVKIMNVNGTVEYHTYRERVDPSAVATMFFLKNRKPDEWKDRRELTGKDGAPLGETQPTIVIVKQGDDEDQS